MHAFIHVAPVHQADRRLPPRHSPKRFEFLGGDLVDVEKGKLGRVMIVLGCALQARSYPGNDARLVGSHGEGIEQSGW
jgi:hypothetical protein